MSEKDLRIDEYIEKSAAFAQPILKHLREVVHKACPQVEETIKWGMPHFDYKGIMCSMAAFKQHVAFGFFKASLLEDAEGILTLAEKHSMGHLGKITSVKDIPKDNVLKAYIKQAMKLNDDGVKLAKPKAAKIKELDTPQDLQKALSKNKIASKIFEEFSFGKRKEYIEWLEDAKTETTREKRLLQAIEWISEGKIRHWKYQKS